MANFSAKSEIEMQKRLHRRIFYGARSF